ncbi:MAG: alpha-D-glucose phosphate-specific phosphoglucomutase [Alphaproteobacteria bacterium]|nr:alpha-D-glucose phosphate-specific phosphoglucomutase [Alphaproteobacteria bacterium]
MRVEFTPFTTQKPGTGGLRRPTREFTQPHYVESFVQAVITRLKLIGKPIKTCAIGGDGRYPNDKVLPRIIKVLLANGVEKILVANKDFVCITPAISHMIRHHGTDFGLVLSASHNPAGIDKDYGIKVEMANGGGPSEGFTNPLYEDTKKMTSYEIADMTDAEALSRATIIDANEDYFELMKSMFDFEAIHKWFKAGNTFRMDCMNAAAGPLAKRIFCGEFGCPDEWILRATPMPDFGGLHPEPNPAYNPDFFKFMMDGKADFGTAVDGDGDRNMVIGAKTFITPPDALAVMAMNYKDIPYYRNRLTGVARTLPSSNALDLVAEDIGLKCYTPPTGWKFLGSLLEAGLIQLCGEESFGQGGDYIREKDAIFAILYWLNMMGSTGKNAGELLHDLWAKYGRVFYSQFSFEGVDAEKAAALYERMKTTSYVGQFGVVKQELFNYTDPATGEVAVPSPGLGIQLFTADKGRIFFRLSGTGTHGATLRFYIEKHEADPAKFAMNNLEYLKPFMEIFERIFKVAETFNNPKITIAI